MEIITDDQNQFRQVRTHIADLEATGEEYFDLLLTPSYKRNNQYRIRKQKVDNARAILRHKISKFPEAITTAALKQMARENGK